MRIWSFFLQDTMLYQAQSRWHNSSQGSLGMFRLWCTQALRHLIWRSCVYIVILSCIPIPFKWNLHTIIECRICRSSAVKLYALPFLCCTSILRFGLSDEAVQMGPKSDIKRSKAAFLELILTIFIFAQLASTSIFIHFRDRCTCVKA